MIINTSCTSCLQEITAERAYEILKRISDEDAKCLGFNPKSARPEWMLLTVLPVPPPHVRPSVMMDASNRCTFNLQATLRQHSVQTLTGAGRCEKHAWLLHAGFGLCKAALRRALLATSMTQSPVCMAMDTGEEDECFLLTASAKGSAASIVVSLLLQV